MNESPVLDDAVYRKELYVIYGCLLGVIDLWNQYVLKLAALREVSAVGVSGATTSICIYVCGGHVASHQLNDAISLGRTIARDRVSVSDTHDYWLYSPNHNDIRMML